MVVWYHAIVCGVDTNLVALASLSHFIVGARSSSGGV